MARRIDSFSKSSRKEMDVVEGEVIEKEASGSLLTEEEMREIEDDIKAEIIAEAKKSEKERYRSEARRRIRVAKGLEEPQVTVLVDIPGFADKIVLDGRPYYHGYTYTVPDSVASCLMDQMDKSWRHEDNVGGANHNEYRKPRNTSLSGKSGAHNVATIQNSSMHANPLSSVSQGRMQPKLTTTQNIAGV